MVVAFIIPLAVMVFAYTVTCLTLQKSVKEARAMAGAHVKYELFLYHFASKSIKLEIRSD